MCDSSSSLPLHLILGTSSHSSPSSFLVFHTCPCSPSLPLHLTPPSIPPQCPLLFPCPPHHPYWSYITLTHSTPPSTFHPSFLSSISPHLSPLPPPSLSSPSPSHSSRQSANCKNHCRFMLDVNASRFVDFQKVRIQETQQELPRGSIPRRYPH